MIFFFFNFPRKQDLAFHANCLHCKSILEKNKKNISVCHLLKILPRVVGVKELFHTNDIFQAK